SLRSRTRSPTSLCILKNCASNPFCPHLELVMWFSTHSVEAERRESLPRDLGETSSESTSNPSIWKSQRRESPQRQILDDSGDSISQPQCEPLMSISRIKRAASS